MKNLKSTPLEARTQPANQGNFALCSFFSNILIILDLCRNIAKIDVIIVNKSSDFELIRLKTKTGKIKAQTIEARDT